MTETLQNIIGTYKKQFIEDILTGMEGFLDNKQLSELNKSLYYNTVNLNFADNPKKYDLDYEKTNELLIQEFIKAKKVKGLSKKTLTAYMVSIKSLKKWTIKSFLELNSEDMKNFFIFYQAQNNCSNTTLNNIRRNLSSFFKFLIDSEKIIINPMLRIPPMKEPKRVKKGFTYEEIEKLRWYYTERAHHTSSKELSKRGMRNLAIFELLISSGVRIGELITLKKSDVDFDECKALVHGKGDKERIVYFSERAKSVILLYFKTRDDDLDYVFVTQSKNNPKKFSNVNSLISHFEAVSKNVGFHVHAHKFRHYFATQMIKKGMPIEQVQSLLGHESIETTLRYIDMSDEIVEMTHRKYTNF